MLKMAQDLAWKKCPSCNILVDRIDGCNYVRCRCGTGFCYPAAVGSGIDRPGPAALLHAAPPWPARPVFQPSAGRRLGGRPGRDPVSDAGLPGP